MSHLSAEGTSRLKLAPITGVPPARFIVPSHLILSPFAIYHLVSCFYYFDCCLRPHAPLTPNPLHPAACNICSHLLFQAPIGLAALLGGLIITYEQRGVLSALPRGPVSRRGPSCPECRPAGLNQTDSICGCKRSCFCFFLLRPTLA